MNLGKLIATLRMEQEVIRKADEALKKLKARHEITKAEAISALEEEGTDTARNANAVITRTETEIPQAEDWEVFYKFIRRNNAFELLHRRISSQAYRTFMDDRKSKKLIPGTKIYTKVGLNIRKR